MVYIYIHTYINIGIGIFGLTVQPITFRSEKKRGRPTTTRRRMAGLNVEDPVEEFVSKRFGGVMRPRELRRPNRRIFAEKIWILGKMEMKKGRWRSPIEGWVLFC